MIVPTHTGIPGGLPQHAAQALHKVPQPHDSSKSQASQQPSRYPPKQVPAKRKRPSAQRPCGPTLNPSPYTEAQYRAHMNERKEALAKLGGVFIQESMVTSCRAPCDQQICSMSHVPLRT